MKTLTKIVINLPLDTSQFLQSLTQYFEKFIKTSDRTIAFKATGESFLPRIELTESSTTQPKLTFLSDQDILAEIEIKNETQQTKVNPHTYQKIKLDDFLDRIKPFPIVAIDHLGVNFPWFERPVHPKLLSLRQKLAHICLYHTFPTGEAWDFIIPGTQEEITNQQVINYTQTRKPKFELVSFEKSSIPLIQIDFCVEANFDQLAALFPEGILISEIKSVWVYLENPYGIDFCFVLNEPGQKDWSEFFANSRLEM